jgi:hypothetical protein
MKESQLIRMKAMISITAKQSKASQGILLVELISSDLWMTNNYDSPNVT